MSKAIFFIKRNGDRIALFFILTAEILIGLFLGLFGVGVFTACLIFIFFCLIFWRVFPHKGKLEFYNKRGKFEMFDVVYDRGSATRPSVPGVLKYDVEAGWFIIYDDGFEWPLSDFKNIEKWQ